VPPCVPAEEVDQVDSTILVLDPTMDPSTLGVGQVVQAFGEVDAANRGFELLIDLSSSIL